MCVYAVIRGLESHATRLSGLRFFIPQQQISRHHHHHYHHHHDRRRRRDDDDDDNNNKRHRGLDDLLSYLSDWNNLGLC